MEWAEDKVLPHINSGGVEEEGKGQRKRSVTSSATKHDLCGQVLKVGCSSPSSMVVTPRQRGFYFTKHFILFCLQSFLQVCSNCLLVGLGTPEFVLKLSNFCRNALNAGMILIALF